MADPISLECMNYSSSDSVSTTESVQTTYSASSTNVSTQVGITISFPSTYNSTSYTLTRTSTSAIVSLSSSTSAKTTSSTCISGSPRSTTSFSRTNSAPPTSRTRGSSSATFTTLTTPLHTTKRHQPGVSIDFSSTTASTDTAAPTSTASSFCMPSSDSGVINPPTSSSSSSIILNTSNADAKTSFSRNTGAIIGVALASGTSLLVVALLIFLGCSRLRRGRLRETGGSNQHLTSDSPGRGSLRSPIDGDEDYFSPARPNLLAAMQLPHPGTPQISVEGAETVVAEGASSSESHINHNTLQTVELRQAPVAFPTHLQSNTSPQGPYPRFHFPRSQDHDASSPPGLLPAPNTTEKGITRTSDTPKILVDPYLPANDHRPMDAPIPNWAAWLYRPSARATNSSPSTPQTRDESLPRVPDGLLHPLLSRRFGPIPLGSERSFLDNVDYSRPISGIHARVDSFTTFSTQATVSAEAELGHDNDKP